MHVGLVYFFHRWLRFYISHDAVGSIAAVAVMALTMVAGVMLLLMPAISSCQAPPLHSEGSFTGRNQEPGLNVVLVCASSISLSTVSAPAFFWFKKASDEKINETGHERERKRPGKRGDHNQRKTVIKKERK